MNTSERTGAAPHSRPSPWHPLLLIGLLVLATACGPTSPTSLPAAPTSPRTARPSATATPIPTASPTAPPTEPPDTPTAIAALPTSTATLPPKRAANADVLYVQAVQDGDGKWTFHVTVQHPDTGWEDYADGWDVLTPDGTVLKLDVDSSFTRLLLHPHVNEQPFTRSQSGIVIPAGVTQVRVRAHDLVDGYGGQEVVVDLTVASGPDFEVSGATVAPPSATPTPTATPVAFPSAIALEPILSGFREPVYLTHAGEASRLFIVEKAGRIRLVENGVLQLTPFLDITDRVGSTGYEQGLLSLSFPPNGAASGIFYVNYTDSSGDTVVARYRLLDSDLRQADPNSEQVILHIAQPASNHNGGQLQFGPDGYLYVGMGDGGQAGDPWGNAQNPNTLLGKMLRLNVAGTDTYTIPDDNPFVGQDGIRPEIWALGLRNPWRFAFDRATGDLYIADVGQNRYEEVDFQPAGSPGGENYGWDVMEGSHCFEPETGCDASGLVQPIAEYGHSWGCSITGGTVYRGTRYPQMAGVYLFGDFCSGHIWGLRRGPTNEWTMALLLKTDVAISSFGEDATGELYVAGYDDGTIYHLTGEM